MLDQELVLSTKTGLDQQGHLNNPYAQFHQYQQSMATYNNMGYAFPAAMYPQNGYGYQLSPYPHAPTSPTHDITEKPEGGTVRLTAKGKKIRKPRTIYSSLQVQQLNKMFQRTQYLALPERAELAAKLGLTQTQVKIWFQNRRSKCKKMYKAVQNGQLAGFDAAELAADLGGKLSQMMVGPESPMPSPHHNPGGDASLSGGPRGDTDPTSPPDQKPRHSESENCASGAAASLLAQRHASEASGGPHSNIPIGALQGELQGMMSTRDMTSPRSEGMRDMMMSSPQTTTENPSEHRRTATTTTMMQHSREHFVVSHKDCDSPIANYPSNAPFSPKSMQGVPDSYFSQRKNEYPPSMMMYQNAGQIDPAHYMYWHYGDMSNAQQQIMT